METTTAAAATTDDLLSRSEGRKEGFAVVQFDAWAAIGGWFRGVEGANLGQVSCKQSNLGRDTGCVKCEPRVAHNGGEIKANP